MGLGRPARLGQPWSQCLASLRPKPGSIPGGLGRRSCQSQFHHLGADLPLPSLSSPPYPPLIRYPREGGFLHPEARPDSATAGSRSPTHRSIQASPHPPLGVSQVWPFLLRRPLRFCFSLTPDALHSPEPETFLPWGPVLPNCSFVGN